MWVAKQDFEVLALSAIFRLSVCTVHHLSLLPQQRASELGCEDRVGGECVQGREGRALPMVDWCLLLASGFGVSESPTEPWRTRLPAACSGEDRLLIWGGGCLSLSLIHQLLPEPFWVAVPGRGRQFWEQKESMRGERELCRGNRIPGDSLFLIIMAIF